MAEQTISWGELLFQHARNTPGKTAIIAPPHRISYQDLEKQVNRLCNWLLENELQKGDRLAVICDKSPQFIIAFLACLKTGIIFTPLNFRTPPAEMEFVLKLTTPKLLLADVEYLMEYYDVLESVFPIYNRLINSHMRSFGPRWIDVIDKSSDKEPAVSVSNDDVVYLNFTSGSTGSPKCALTTGANLYWNTRAAVETLGLTQDDVHFSMFPVYGHPHELLCRAIYLGGTMVLQDQLSPKTIARILSEHKVTLFMAVPSLIDMLVSVMEDEKSELDFSNLRMLEAGGMHSTDGLTARIRKTFKKYGTLFLPVWGSTETAGIALASLVEGERPMGSVGKPLKYYETKIVDEDGNECLPGEVGELVVRGPGVVKEYMNDSEETARAFWDGWYHTSDLMKCDENGFYYFVYRRQGMMKVAGMKVSPQEIDNVLSLHPKIKEAICVPAYDQLRGEIPKAIVVLKPNEHITPQTIKKYCREHLAEYKVPRAVEFWPYLPKTATGKIDHKKIKQMVLDGKRPMPKPKSPQPAGML